MIKKYNEYINEKLSDKLSGFNEEEILNQLINDKIKWSKYFELCSKYNLNINYEYLKPYFLNNTIDFNKYYRTRKYYHYIKLPSKEYLKELFLNGNITINIYKDICRKEDIELPSKNEIYTSIKNYKDSKVLLNTAIRYNYVDLVKFAIKNGADIQHDNNYLYEAISNKSFECFKYLLETGLQISNINDMLIFAINSKSFKIVDYLYDKIKDKINFNDMLKQGINYDFIELTKFSLEHGVLN